MRKIICIAVMCFMIIAVFSGCTVLQKLGLQKTGEDELYPASSVVMGEDEAKKLTDKVPIHLYFSNQDGTKLKLEIRYIPVSEAKKSVNNLATLIVKELIKGPSAETGLKATIPSGTALRSPVSINSGVATVDFTKDFITKHPGGKAAEQLTIYSIVNSLTELKEVQKVKFTINGKAQKEFKGNFQFDAPFPRAASLISKDVPSAVPPAGDKSKDTRKKDSDTKKDKTDDKSKDKSKDKTDQQKKSDTKKDDSKPTDAGVDDSTSTSQNSLDGGDGSEATYLDNLE